MAAIEPLKLSANQRFLVRELERRGVAVSALYLEDRWLVAKFGSKTARLYDIDGPGNGYVDCLVASNKHVAKLLLQESGVSVPRGAIFNSDNLQAAWEYLHTHQGTWVLKPCFGSQGNGVHTGLKTSEDLKHAYEDFSGVCGATSPFLIEEQIEGVEHRVFITARGDVAITRREAAHVIGDGTSTIRQLVYTESDRRTYPQQKTSEGAIPLDEVALRFIAQQGLTPEDRLEKGRKLYLRGNSNLKTGGTCTDATDEAHDSVLELAAKVAQVFSGAPVLGIDFIFKDIAQPQTPDSYSVIEVNTCPGLGMHMVPGTGAARDVASSVADVVFPETAGRPASARPRRLPVCETLALD